MSFEKNGMLKKNRLFLMSYWILFDFDWLKYDNDFFLNIGITRYAIEIGPLLEEEKCPQNIQESPSIF